MLLLKRGRRNSDVFGVARVEHHRFNVRTEIVRTGELGEAAVERDFGDAGSDCRGNLANAFQVRINPADGEVAGGDEFGESAGGDVEHLVRDT